MADTPHPSYLQGMAFLKERKIAEALAAFNSAIADEPENPHYYSDRGVAYFHNKEKDKAFADMNRAVEIAPDYSYHYAARAFIRDSMGDLEGAIEDYEIAVRLDPENAVAHNNLGLLIEKMGYKKQAQEHYNTADTLAGDIPEGEEGQERPGLKPQQSNSAAVSETVRQEPRTTKEIDQEAKEEFESEQAAKASSGAHVRTMLDVFRKKETFKDFVRFVRNGFKNSDEE